MMSLDPHEGYFELSGVLVNHGLMDQNLYIKIPNPTPFWNKAKPIIEAMRSKRSDSHRISSR
jgi:hypothetical protein